MIWRHGYMPVVGDDRCVAGQYTQSGGGPLLNIVSLINCKVRCAIMYFNIVSNLVLYPRKHVGRRGPTPSTTLIGRHSRCDYPYSPTLLCSATTHQRSTFSFARMTTPLTITTTTCICYIVTTQPPHSYYRVTIAYDEPWYLLRTLKLGRGR